MERAVWSPEGFGGGARKKHRHQLPGMAHADAMSLMIKGQATGQTPQKSRSRSDRPGLTSQKGLGLSTCGM
eukprot:365265-Chlamydomonas_euryale.AAC.7